MSFRISGNSFDAIYREILSRISADWDYQASPRGKPVRECIAAGFTLTNPRNRLVMSPARKMNYGFAVGELCWYLRGDDDLDTMLYYNKRMSQFSDDNKTINSAYGARMFNECAIADSQFDTCILELLKDPDSRRAVMHINKSSDLIRAVSPSGSKDVPCTMSVQLLIRDRLLHMHVLMRSNDIIWGMPYDVFSFTCLQEAFMLMMKDAGVQVDDIGYYHHTAGSLHLYGDHYSLAEEVAREEMEPPAQMEPFTLDEIGWLAQPVEKSIRQGKAMDGLRGEPSSSSILWMIDMLTEHRKKRDVEENKLKCIDELAQQAQDDGLYDFSKAEIHLKKMTTAEALDELTRLTEEFGGYDKEMETK